SLYYLQIERLLKAGRRVDAVGIQFHMTSERGREWERGRFCYNPRHLYKVLDRYSDFGLPLQVTEITIPAYSLDPQDENIQADLAERLYSLWFSHPNMEQIIYWNLPDGYAFAAEPGDMTAGENQRFGGLLRFDMSKKPIYDRLDELINHRWRTDVSVTTDGQGKACFNGFYGDYEAIIDGKTYLLQLKKDADRNYEVNL
ncbi:MAG: endo-1,4-beta-xylanase, partial [Clostridia bacterium]|nr:endo-1,4-beta-xylanase [Clostridia bacterium]